MIVLILTWGAPAKENLGEAQLSSNHRLLTAARWGLLGLLILGTLAPQLLAIRKHGFQFKAHGDRQTGKEHKYACFIPLEYDGRKPYPVVLHFHGFGARGREGFQLTQEVLGSIIREQGSTFEMLAVSVRFGHRALSPGDTSSSARQKRRATSGPGP